jgi:hypothetical protein
MEADYRGARPYSNGGAGAQGIAGHLQLVLHGARSCHPRLPRGPGAWRVSPRLLVSNAQARYFGETQSRFAIAPKMPPNYLPLAIAGVFALCAFLYGWRSKRRIQRLTGLAREHKIRSFVFTGEMLHGLTKTYPALEHKDTQLVARALREFFLVHARAKGALIGMPSKAVDALWHEFILDTRAYAEFCKEAFGSYFHHVPAGVMNKEGGGKDAMTRTWRLACLEENINPSNPTRIPLLFALDMKLDIPGAVLYSIGSFEQSKKDKEQSGGSSCGGGSSEAAGASSTAGDGCGGGCGGD